MPIFEEIFDADDVLSQFNSRDARTEEEEGELLKAVAEKWGGGDAENKWSKMLDEYNARALEKKSKPWLKRAVAKLNSSASKDIAVADQTPSKAQLKKQAKEDAANEQAAQKVAREMEDKDAAGQAAVRRKATVEHFWDCITATPADHMEEEAEQIFGCKMGDSVGDLVHGTWSQLAKKKRIKQKQVEESLEEGTLPASFVKWMHELPAVEHNKASLQLRSSPDLLKKIPWDVNKMMKMARPGAEMAVTTSIQSSEKMDSPLKAPSQPELMKFAREQHDVARAEDAPKSKAKKSAAKSKAAPAPTPAKAASAKAVPEAPSENRSIGDYTWVDQDEEVEVSVYVGEGVARKDVSVFFKPRGLQMTKPTELSLDLHAYVTVEGCGWTLNKEEVVITLEKKKSGEEWPSLLKGEKKPASASQPAAESTGNKPAVQKGFFNKPETKAKPATSAKPDNTKAKPDTAKVAMSEADRIRAALERAVDKQDPDKQKEMSAFVQEIMQDKDKRAGYPSGIPPTEHLSKDDMNELQEILRKKITEEMPALLAKGRGAPPEQPVDVRARPGPAVQTAGSSSQAPTVRPEDAPTEELEEVD